MSIPEKPPDRSGGDRLRRIVDVGTGILSDLDLESVLRSVVNAGREVTDARYAALGVLDPDGEELERFIYVGIDEETRREIGNLPRGRGVLGELIRDPVPLRLRDVNQHPHAFGFPPGHPQMSSFLGVPIAIRGEVFGNLYLTEKQGAEEFSAADEEAALMLATWAGIAVQNARLYTALREQEEQTEQALRRAETSVDIARAVGGETNVERVLDLIVKRARALVEARTLLVLLRRGGRLQVAAQAGEVRPQFAEFSVPTEDAVFQAAMQERLAQHLKPGSPPSEARVRELVGAEAALVVPLIFRERAVGALVALDREGVNRDFEEEDLRLLQSFAASAATAVATAQTVESDRLQQQIEIAEKERERWARELHDETLQSLAAIRISLAAALRSDAPDREEKVAAAARQAVDHMEQQINELSRLINDLRPASLERLGLGGALEALAEECSARGEFSVDTDLSLDGRLSREEERVVYRIAQEALNNCVKHSAATHVGLSAKRSGAAIQIEVDDDGTGLDPDALQQGRGLIGMRERVELLGGEISIRSNGRNGATVSAMIPVSGS